VRKARLQPLDEARYGGRLITGRLIGRFESKKGHSSLL
jgi:hypothetical protein